jgi:serine/threonine protein kinase
MSSIQQDQTLGKYTIVKELGRGGFATVYLAQDTVLRRAVALKILHPALLVDPAFVSRFENDARAAAQLDHPHIAAIHELGHHCMPTTNYSTRSATAHSPAARRSWSSRPPTTPTLP